MFSKVGILNILFLEDPYDYVQFIIYIQMILVEPLTKHLTVR